MASYRIGEWLRCSNRRPFVIESLCELQRLQRLMNDFTRSRTVWIARDYIEVVDLGYCDQCHEVMAR